MFHCERCGIRFSTGALSGRLDCPRCNSRDGVTVLLTWEPLLAARTAAALSEASRQAQAPRAQSPRSTSISPNFSASSSAS
jgi:predicted  nucleic acid-binding Zn-ribbon protein